MIFARGITYRRGEWHRPSYRGDHGDHGPILRGAKRRGRDGSFNLRLRGYKHEEREGAFSYCHNIEKETEPSPIPTSEAMVTESIVEPLALVSKTTISGHDMEPLTLAPPPPPPPPKHKIGGGGGGRWGALSEDIELLAPVSKSIPFEADVSVPTLESIPSEEEAPIQGDLEAPIAEPMPIVLKESAIPIVEEPLL